MGLFDWAKERLGIHEGGTLEFLEGVVNDAVGQGDSASGSSASGSSTAWRDEYFNVLGSRFAAIVGAVIVFADGTVMTASGLHPTDRVLIDKGVDYTASWLNNNPLYVPGEAVEKMMYLATPSNASQSSATSRGNTTANRSNTNTNSSTNSPSFTEQAAEVSKRSKAEMFLRREFNTQRKFLMGSGKKLLKFLAIVGIILVPTILAVRAYRKRNGKRY
jgi:hypothetical protein